MLLNIVAFKNCQINAFTNPQYLDIDADKAAVQLARSLVLGDKATKEKYRYLDMYCLGTFDDETGAIVTDGAKLLLHCADYCKESIVDGKEE